MRPRTDVAPTRSVGSAASGRLKDTLISMRLSLTVGSRWRTAPASQLLAGAAELTACSIRSAGTASESETAAELRKKLRRSIGDIGAVSTKVANSTSEPYKCRVKPLCGQAIILLAPCRSIQREQSKQKFLVPDLAKLPDTAQWSVQRF